MKALSDKEALTEMIISFGRTRIQTNSVFEVFLEVFSAKPNLTTLSCYFQQIKVGHEAVVYFGKAL